MRRPVAKTTRTHRRGFVAFAAKNRRPSPNCRRLRAEPLEDRTMLSAVTWTIDSSQSYLSMAIPDQVVDVDGTSVTIRVRNQSGGNSGPWNVGNTAAISGTISTNYVDGASIEFPAGQPDIAGVNSGSYRPNPSDFDPTAIDDDNPNGSFTNTTSAPGVFGARVRASVSIITADAAFISFYNTRCEVSSAVLPVTGGSFAATALNVGIVSSDLAIDGLSVFLIGQQVPDTLTTVSDMTATNSAATGTITNLGGQNRQLTIPIALDLSIPIDDDPTHNLSATGTGQLVATAVVDLPSTISGLKFNDVNGNGSRDTGEPGLAGWTINLDTNADGSVDATTTTDASGNYSFTNLEPGTYRVREVPQTGWTQTTANPADVTATSGSSTTASFGNFQQITLGGLKFNDLNGNGSRDAGEPGLAGWTINLDTNADGSVDASRTTDASGNYSFTNLGPGTYRLREVQQTGWTKTTSDPADITATSGSNPTVHFGNFQQITIRGLKFNDLNGSGALDAGEPGLAGWTINLDRNADGSVDATAATDASGNYSFTSLGPGTYRLREVPQTGWTKTTSDPADIAAQSGVDVAAVNFGSLAMDCGDAPDPTYPTLLASNGARHALSEMFLGTRIDKETDGQPNATATGDDVNPSVASDEDGVVFNTPLVVGQSATITVTATGSTGMYLSAWLDFAAAGTWGTAGDQLFVAQTLNPGANVLAFLVPTGAAVGTSYARFRLHTNNAGIPFTGFELSGEVEDYRVSIVAGGTIRGQKFQDLDDDGVKDGGEPGLQGWTITLDTNADGTVDATATTDAGGYYSFTNLDVGVYRVREVPQAGWTQTTANPADITLQSGEQVAGVDFGNLAMDFGDAPAPTYPTLLAGNGARHALSEVFLGTRIDTEADGQPNATATGDDVIPSGANDEDGVVFSTPLAVAQPATITVTATGPTTGMYLSAWLDFNADGTWETAGDAIFVAEPLAPGANVLSFVVPAGATVGTTFARFRLHANPAGIPFTGFEASGEVEDYQVLVSSNIDADGNGSADALTDGILMLRYLFDPTGAWNYSDALGSGATRTTRPQIRTYLDGGQMTALDADGNGSADALTDGILILRYLFDPAGAWNYSDALGSGATRTTRSQIKAYLDQFNPASGPDSDLAGAGFAEEPVTQAEVTQVEVSLAETASTIDVAQPADYVAIPVQVATVDAVESPPVVLGVSRGDTRFGQTTTPEESAEPATARVQDVVLQQWKGSRAYDLPLTGLARLHRSDAILDDLYNDDTDWFSRAE